MIRAQRSIFFKKEKIEFLFTDFNPHHTRRSSSSSTHTTCFLCSFYCVEEFCTHPRHQHVILLEKWQKPRGVFGGVVWKS